MIVNQQNLAKYVVRRMRTRLLSQLEQQLDDPDLCGIQDTIFVTHRCSLKILTSPREVFHPIRNVTEQHVVLIEERSEL
jgi:hypothetical protein